MATSFLSFPIQRELPSNIITTAVQKLGYRSPKKEQVDIIHGFLNGREVFGILPTGFGKSLCYACLPMLFDELKITASLTTNHNEMHSFNHTRIITPT